MQKHDQEDNKDSNNISHSFNEVASSLSKEFGLDVYDLKDAYKDKQDSLSLLNETFKQAKDSRSSNILWTIVAGLIVWPVAVWPGYLWYQNSKKIETIKDTLQEEISSNKLLSHNKQAKP
jgi:cytoskeletal protein RodZ